MIALYTNNIPGWMSTHELNWLYEQAKRFETVLEVGTWAGRSGGALASGCKGHVWTVDHFLGSPSERETNHAIVNFTSVYEIAKRNLSEFKNITILNMSSDEASIMFDGDAIDMIFIDGDHEAESVLKDLNLWEPKVSKLFCGHDANWGQIQWALNQKGIQWMKGPGSIWFKEYD